MQPCSLQVRSGEIVGLAGLVGAGRSELAQLIFGVRKATGGMIEVDGEPVVIHPRAAIENGIGFHREPQGAGAISGAGGAGEHHHGDAGARRHLRLAEPQKRSRFPMTPSPCSISACRILRCAQAGSPAATSKTADLPLGGDRPAHSDSGRTHARRGRRGKSEIYRIMNQMARKGVAILMISSELPEVVGMSDRVYVMREGSIAGELHGRDISQENIMTLATGVNDTHHQAV